MPRIKPDQLGADDSVCRRWGIRDCKGLGNGFKRNGFTEQAFVRSSSAALTANKLGFFDLMSQERQRVDQGFLVPFADRLLGQHHFLRRHGRR